MEIKNINGYDLKDETARNQINVLDTFIKPEQFGAVGDGVTDDSQAFIDMIAYVDSIVPTKTYINESSCKDYSNIQFEFSKRYAISKPIDFVNTYGVVLNNLKLIATDNFEGEYLIGFSNFNRQVNMENCYLNGNLKANKCLSVIDNTLGFKIVNGEIIRFKTHGLYFGTGKGHETIISNTKINQVEWGEKDTLNSLVPNGIGLYLDTERYDNHFNNNIINYCLENTMVVKSGANYFNQCHFYGTPVLLDGYHNYINDCYFDTTLLHMKAQNQIKGCTFKSNNDYFIKIIEDFANLWRTSLTYITDCIFSTPKEGGVSTPIIFNETWTDTSKFYAECTNNIFENVTPFKYKSSNFYVPAPWKANTYSGNAISGTCKIGDFIIQWGEVSESGYVNFPEEFTGYVVDVNLTPTGTITGAIPYANDISTKRFWANGVSVKCKWVAIGRVNWD